jgi:hypothetical protein
MALIEHCIENLPEQPDDTLRVPLPALAHRVLEIYWQQVQPFDGNELRQSTGSRARILNATKELRVASGRATGSVDVARLRAPAAYDHAIDDVVLCLAQQPLHRLQNCRAGRRVINSSTTTRSCTTTCHGRRCARMATPSH